jgi:hypothetical protein
MAIAVNEQNCRFPIKMHKIHIKGNPSTKASHIIVLITILDRMESHNRLNQSETCGMMTFVEGAPFCTIGAMSRNRSTINRKRWNHTKVKMF